MALKQKSADLYKKTTIFCKKILWNGIETIDGYWLLFELLLSFQRRQKEPGTLKILDPLVLAAPSVRKDSGIHGAWGRIQSPSI